ncbi:hypothetical protein PHLCEN_2v4130 [Hermanssonia centrifuga]|uniref:Uncharacterized protein n=1 Tax=Hermanssonia centrifuga TaxID=98765 RepID=A0A2R6PZA2_9APHY|nr:hypothetical protein PHLCEN_2v4130 [Hermanssonia centrifuga]
MRAKKMLNVDEERGSISLLLIAGGPHRARDMNKLSGCGPKTTEQRSARVVKNKAHISEGQDLGKQGNRTCGDKFD